jgi:cytochrome c-type biogenesis protein CcmE
VTRPRLPVRLVVALSVASALAVFLVYTAVAGGGTPTIKPSELGARTGKVALVGMVQRPIRGDAHSAPGLRFRLRDPNGVGAAAVPVVYHGSVPDLFAAKRNVVVGGRLEHGVFVASSIVTKCPSKYAPAKQQKS